MSDPTPALWLAAQATYQRASAAIFTDVSCAYCGEPAQSYDHVVPRSKGGTDDALNLVPTCRSCNASKAGKAIDDWITNLEAYMAGQRKAQLRLENARAVRDGRR